MNRGSHPALRTSAATGAPIIACAHCIADARTNDDPIAFAVTIINGNATCAAHLEPTLNDWKRGLLR